MTEPRVRRIDARPASAEVQEYRELVKLAQSPLPDSADEAARELVRLCRLRSRPALLRTNLRFGRGLLLIRVTDLDGDGKNEMLVIDSDHIVHTPRLALREGDGGPVASWTIGTHRYRGKLLGVSFSSFGVFSRQEAIVTSVEESEGGAVYRELKLTCDGTQWDVSELEHRRTGTPGFGEIRLIGDSSEPGRVPVLRGRFEDSRLWVEILDDRMGRRSDATSDFSKVSFLPGEVTDLVLCEDELVVAYARGGLQRIGRDGRLRSLLFPQWRFVCLAYAPARKLGMQAPSPNAGLLLGGTSFGYVFAMDTAQTGVMWRMDAGFLFSAMTLADIENSGRIDLVLGGIDGGMRVYELTDTALLDQRCRKLYQTLGQSLGSPPGQPLGPSATERLLALAPPRHDAHAAVQLYLLSRILESTGPASQAVVDLVRWFTSGQPGWHMLPERAQREAVVILEHFLLLHLPQLARDEPRATPTGPLPLLTMKQIQGQAPLDTPAKTHEPDTRLQLARTVLAELVEVYLGAPRLVRHQIDRISRRLFEQYWQHSPANAADAAVPSTEPPIDQPPPELKRLLTVRSLRARDYATGLAVEAATRLNHIEGMPESDRPKLDENNEVVMRVLRAIGLIEELRLDRFSMELERLDLVATAIDPLMPTSEGVATPTLEWPSRSWIVGIGRRGALHIEPLEPLPQPSPRPGEYSELNSGPMPLDWPWQPTTTGQDVQVPGTVRFIEVRKLWQEGDAVLPAVIVGIDEAGDTKLLIYSLLKNGKAVLRGEARCGGSGAEPIGYDLHLSPSDDAASPESGEASQRTPPARETLILRVPGTGERGRPSVLAVDTQGGQLRVRAHVLPAELLAVLSNSGGSLHITSARVSLRRPGSKTLSVPAPAATSCAALADGATLAAVGTSTGQVQVFGIEGDSLRLMSQHLFPKGISALCFVPEGVFGVPCLALGTEDEQVHILAVDFRRDGQELVRLAAGGTPQRMMCRPLSEGGYRLLILLQGGVLTSWEAHPQDEHMQAIERLLELGSRAAGSRANMLRAALRGQGPHIRAVALRELLRSAREGRIAGSIVTAGMTSSDNKTMAPRPPPGRTNTPVGTPRPTGERGTPAVSSVLHLAKLLLQSEPQPGLDANTRAPSRSDLFDVASWPLPRPPRARILILPLFEALVPIALSGPGSGADAQQAKLARELLTRLVHICDEPLSIRGELLQCIETHVRSEHIEELPTWLPQIILHDTRSAEWPFAIDSVAALFLRHLQRLDRAKLFDQAEPVFFRSVVAVLEAVSPTQPSRFLLTNMALLLRSALSWERAFLAGDLGRVRLHMPHAVIETMCQPEILPDSEARSFLTGVSRRWGPRLPTIGAEDNDDTLSGVSSPLEGEIDWLFEVAIENGFDQIYYERLADELARCALPVSSDGITPDSWALLEMVQGVLRLFDMTNLAELQASLQPAMVDKALAALRAHRSLSEQHLSYRYRDEAWAFIDESTYLAEQQFLSQALQELDRKTNKAQVAHSLDELAAQLDQRRNALRLRLLDRLSGGTPLGHAGAFVSRMLVVRPVATVVALLTVWWQVLVEEATRLRTEPDFEVRLVSDLGVSEGRRVLRYAVMLAADAARTAHGVVLSVRSVEPKEVRARALDPDPVDLEPGHELGMAVECPALMAADGLRYRIEIELSHDGDKRTERVIEGQFRRESRQLARALFDSFADRLPTLFQQRKEQLLELLRPAHASVALVTAFPAHAYELLGEAVNLDWPERPIDTLEGWRMVNVAARSTPAGSAAPPASSQRASNPTLRDLVGQVGARIGGVLGLPNAERLDTVEALVRAVSEAPLPTSGAQARGLIILGLPELCEKARLEENEQRQLLLLGARVSLAYRGRSLLLLSPQAAALSLALPAAPAIPSVAPTLEVAPRSLELLDLDHVADPYSVHRLDEKMRTELEQALTSLLVVREGAGAAAGVTHQAPLTNASATQAALRSLMDVTGTDLRLVAECMPIVEQALRERSRAPLSASAFESRVGTYLSVVWSSLPLPHRLYLAALCSDAVDLDVADVRPGMVVDAPVYSISGKDRLPTSKVVASAGVRLDQRTIDDLTKVMWLKKVRIRGTLQDSRTVLWTYLKQTRPRLLGRPAVEESSSAREGGRNGERWIDATAADLKRLGLLRMIRLSGDRVFCAFTSPAIREWLRTLLGVAEGEAGLPNTIDGRNLVRQLPLWDAAAVDRALGGSSAPLRTVLGWNRPGVQAPQGRWQDFLELSRACRKWMDGQDEHRFIEAISKYFRLDLVDGTGRDELVARTGGPIPMRSVQVRFREKRQLPWLKRVVLYLPAGQPDRPTLEQVQIDLRGRLPMMVAGASGPQLMPRPDAGFAGTEGTISDTALSAIVIVPELLAEVLHWSRNLFHVAAIDIADLQHAALHDNPVEELIRRLAAAASYAALSPFRSKMGLANQELIEEMFYGRRSLLEEIRGQRQENFLIVGPRKIGKTSLLQRVRFELEQQGYRVIPRGMDYTTAPTSRELLRAMITELYEDIEPQKAQQGFALGEVLPPLRSVIDQWTRRHPDHSVAIVLDEIDTILRTERRAYLLGEWREASALGQAMATLLPTGSQVVTKAQVAALRSALHQTGFPRDVIEGVLEGLQTPPDQRRQSPLLEELRSASALVLAGGAVCRVILAGHAELVEARWDLFGPLLNFAKLRMLGPLDETSAERMVREPFTRLGLRFESAAVEQILLEKTFRVPAWIQHCGALIIQSIDERLRSSRREEQKITERDVVLALEKVHAEERTALQSENGLYMLGPECSFVLLCLVDEPWFTIDSAVDYLHVLFYQTLDPKDRQKIARRDEDFFAAFSPEVVRRIVRDLTNTFYLTSDEAEYLTTEGRPSYSSPGFNVPALAPSAVSPGTLSISHSAGTASPSSPGLLRPQDRDRLRRSYKVSRSIVSTVFHDELSPQKRIELARRAMRLWQEGRGVWARTANKAYS